MRLLWSFMGYSVPYNIFTGAVEMLGGILLFVPRLVTLGGLVAAAATANVFMLNMSYDVSVKLYSFHLLAMSVFVVASDQRRLSNFFLFNRKVEASVSPPLFRRPWLNRGALGLQVLERWAAQRRRPALKHMGVDETGVVWPRPDASDVRAH